MDECDVILDSGADTSALPLKYAAVGVAGPKPDTCFVDAQGAPLTVEATRLANIQFGDVTFRDRFIISDVTCPFTWKCLESRLECCSCGWYSMFDKR